MKNKNICKFIPEQAADKLEVSCFIYETNLEIMKTPYVLTHNRAILVKQGEGRFSFDGKMFYFSAGSLVFGFQRETFYAIIKENCEYMYVDFGGTRSEILFRRFGINCTNRCFSGFDGVIPLWHDSLTRASGTNLDLASESILLYTFSRLTGMSSEKDTLISRIVEITEENFRDSELSVCSVAKELSYNAKYISHLFKQKMGVSYSEYLRTLRIKYAVSLFDHGIDSVKNVAFLSGFTDPLYFSKVFRETVGVSPKDYKMRTENE